ncbi:MAG: AMP-binding protein, partial [Actinomyces sp.]|uniref:AMP-binding protein n=1 Tax=Actinomyces sp. TaxID=29317 RepID=UPI0028FF2428
VLRAAQVLVENGVRKGDVCAICLPNCPQALVAFYACMRIGAVAAQHNPLAPIEEIHQQLDRHHGKVAIVWEKSVDAFIREGDQALDCVFTVDISAQMPRSSRALLKLPIERARSTREQMRGERPKGTHSWDHAVARSRLVHPDTPGASAQDLAVILHTGGTNGVPKSVPLTHRNIGSNVNQCIMWVWKLHEGAETFYSLLPYFHAYGLTLLMCAAVRLAATQLVLPKFDVHLALEAHKRHPVTFFVGVPPMFERLMEGAQEEHIDLTSMKWSLCGAMPLSQTLAQQWEEVTQGMVIEGYGMSETSPVIAGVPLAANRRHGALGLVFPSTDIRLVDLEDPSVDVEEGTPGEIIVKGPQVFSGYLGAPEETARVFTEDGWLRTGDVAVIRDGFLMMSDRKKELILSGGFNVYPSQVEDAIRSMPGVKDVAVVGLPSGDAREEVTAALILEDDAPMITLAQVRQWAEKYVSHYALPRQLAIISELPRNPLGKVMRRKVKEQLLDPANRMFSSASKAIGEAAAAVSERLSPTDTSVDDKDSDNE